MAMTMCTSTWHLTGEHCSLRVEERTWLALVQGLSVSLRLPVGAPACAR